MLCIFINVSHLIRFGGVQGRIVVQSEQMVKSRVTITTSSSFYFGS